MHSPPVWIDEFDIRVGKIPLELCKTIHRRSVRHLQGRIEQNQLGSFNTLSLVLTHRCLPTSKTTKERACLLHPCSLMRPTKALWESMSARRHAQHTSVPMRALRKTCRSLLNFGRFIRTNSPRGNAFYMYIALKG